MLKNFYDVAVGAVGMIGTWGGAHLGFWASDEQSSSLRDVVTFLVGTTLGTLVATIAASSVVRRVHKRLL